MDDSYIETDGEYHKLMPMIFVIISAVITILIPIILTISFYVKYADTFEYFNYDTSEVLEFLFSEFVVNVILLNALHVVVAFLYNLFVFAPRPNCRSAVKAAETVCADVANEVPIDEPCAEEVLVEEASAEAAPVVEQPPFYSNSEPPSYT